MGRRALKVGEYIGLVLAIIALALFFIPAAADVLKRWGLHVVIAWLILTLGAALVEYLSGRSWKRITVVTVAVGLIAGVALVAVSRSEQEREDRDRALLESQLKQQREQNEKQLKQQQEENEKLNRRLDEITKMLKEQSPQATPDNLLKKYSHGYTIVSLNQQNLVTLYDSRLLEGWTFKWETARLKDLGNEVEIRLPDMVTNRNNTIIGQLSVVPKRPGASMRVLLMGNVVVSTEILAVAADGIVVAIGFSEDLRPL